jgi:hypothetical protein
MGGGVSLISKELPHHSSESYDKIPAMTTRLLEEPVMHLLKVGYLCLLATPGALLFEKDSALGSPRYLVMGSDNFEVIVIHAIQKNEWRLCLLRAPKKTGGFHLGPILLLDKSLYIYFSLYIYIYI